MQYVRPHFIFKPHLRNASSYYTIGRKKHTRQYVMGKWKSPLEFPGSPSRRRVVRMENRLTFPTVSHFSISFLDCQIRSLGVSMVTYEGMTRNKNSVSKSIEVLSKVVDNSDLFYMKVSYEKSLAIEIYLLRDFVSSSNI